MVLLKVIDNKWMAHLDDMDALRGGIGLQAYGQRDPVVEYKMQGYEMYESMMASIQEETIRSCSISAWSRRWSVKPAAKVTGTNKDASPQALPRSVQSRRYTPTTHAHAVPARSTNSATEELNNRRITRAGVISSEHRPLKMAAYNHETALNRGSKYNMKVGEAVVELDNFKYTLSTYDKPLVEVRDSL